MTTPTTPKKRGRPPKTQEPVARVPEPAPQHSAQALSLPEPPEAPRVSHVWIRALRYVPSTMRIKEGAVVKKSYSLSRRGERGDIARISIDDINHPAIASNHNMLFEIISEQDAQEALSKQGTNQQMFHPAHAGLVDEYGNKIEKIGAIQPSWEAQSITVASAPTSQESLTVGADQTRISTSQRDALIRHQDENRGMPNVHVTHGTVQDPWTDEEAKVIQDNLHALGDNIQRTPAEIQTGLEGFTVKP